MAVAGEAGGVLEVIAKRIAEGIDDGSFPPPGGEARRQDDQVRYWRAFGRLMSSGLPILELLDLLEQEVAGPRLTQATQAIRQAILDGRDVASALARIVAITGGVEAVDRLYATYEAVTPDDVQAAAVRYLIPARRTVAELRGED